MDLEDSLFFIIQNPLDFEKLKIVLETSVHMNSLNSIYIIIIFLKLKIY